MTTHGGQIPWYRTAAGGVLFAVLATFYLFNSGAPLRVDLLALACLAVAVFPPTFLLAASRRAYVHWAVAFASVLLAMLGWDALSWLVIRKAEPFGHLRYTPWIYLLGFGCIVTVDLGAAQLTRWRTRKANPGASQLNANTRP